MLTSAILYLFSLTSLWANIFSTMSSLSSLTSICVNICPTPRGFMAPHCSLDDFLLACLHWFFYYCCFQYLFSSSFSFLPEVGWYLVWMEVPLLTFRVVVDEVFWNPVCFSADSSVHLPTCFVSVGRLFFPFLVYPSHGCLLLLH